MEAALLASSKQQGQGECDLCLVEGGASQELRPSEASSRGRHGSENEGASAQSDISQTLKVSCGPSLWSHSMHPHFFRGAGRRQPTAWEEWLGHREDRDVGVTG